MVSPLGSSAFSILSYDKELSWKSFLTDVVNRSLLAPGHDLFNAITCAVRTLDTAWGLKDDNESAFDSVTQNSDVKVFRFLKNGLIDCRDRGGRMFETPNFRSNVEELAQAFARGGDEFIFGDATSQNFLELVDPGLEDLSPLSLEALLEQTAGEVSPGYIRQIIIKLHSPMKNRNRTDMADWQETFFAEERLNNWFALRSPKVVDIPGELMDSVKGHNLRSRAIIDLDENLSNWFISFNFHNQWVQLVSMLKRDKNTAILSERLDSVDAWSKWIDSSFKMFFLGHKMSIVERLTTMVLNEEATREEITENVIAELSAISGKFGSFKDSMVTQSFNTQGPIGPASFMRFDGMVTNLPYATLALAGIQIGEERTLIHLRIQRIFSLGVLRDHFKRLLVLSARSIVDKVFATKRVISLAKKVDMIASSRTLGFIDGTLMGEGRPENGTWFVDPPRLDSPNRKAKAVIQINLSDDDNELVETLANPLSRVSQKIQDVQGKLMDETIPKNSIEFLELESELDILSLQQQRLIMNFLLQANADSLKRTELLIDDPTFTAPTGPLEEDWETLDFAGSDTLTMEDNLSQSRLLDCGMLPTIDPEMEVFLLSSTFGQIMLEKVRNFPDFLENLDEYKKAIANLAYKFWANPELSKEEKKMVLFPMLKTTFWAPDNWSDFQDTSCYIPKLREIGGEVFDRKLCFVHLIGSPKPFGVQEGPLSFMPVFQGLIGLIDDDLKLSATEKRLLPQEDSNAALLALCFFDSDDNELFYRSSLLLRILRSGDTSDSELMVNGEIRACDMRARIALASKLLKKRGIMLILTCDSAENMSRLMIDNRQLTSDAAFGGKAADFCIIAPSDVNLESARELFKTFESESTRNRATDGMSSLERIAELIKKATPRFFSMACYSAKGDRFFEAKTPLMIPLEISSRWLWSSLEIRGELSHDLSSQVPRVHPQASMVNIFGADSPNDFHHRIAPTDPSFALNTNEMLTRAERFLFKDGRRIVDVTSKLAISRRLSFEEKVLEPRWQGVPFLMRHDKPCVISNNPVDVFMCDDELVEMAVSYDEHANPRRSLMYHMADPMLEPTGFRPTHDLLFEEHESPLGALVNTINAIFDDLPLNTPPISLTSNVVRLLGRCPPNAEQRMVVCWDRVSAATTTWREERERFSWRTFFRKLTPIFRMIVHICLHAVEQEGSFPGFAPIPRCLSGISFFSIDYTTPLRNFLFPKFIKQHLLPVVNMAITTANRQARGRFDKIPNCREESMTWSIINHDFSALKTAMKDHTMARFLLRTPDSDTNNGVPWFLCADEIRIVLKSINTPREDHLLLVLELPFAALLGRKTNNAELYMESRRMAVERFFTDASALSSLSMDSCKNLFRLLTVIHGLLKKDPGNYVQGAFPRFESWVEVGQDLEARRQCRHPVFDFVLRDLEQLILDWREDPPALGNNDLDDPPNDTLDDFESSGIFDDPF